MKNTLLIVNAQKWSFVDEKTGEVKEGVSIHYLESGKKQETTDRLGCAIMKASMKPEIWADLKEVPALYEAELSLGQGAKGVTTVKVDSLNYSDAVFL